MNNTDQFIEIIKKSFDRELGVNDRSIKYVIELPMTKEEYDIFIKIIDNK